MFIYNQGVCVYVCDIPQEGSVSGFVGGNKVFVVTLPTTQGFVAYGTTSFGYADFDNLLIEDNPVKMTTFF